MSTLHLWAATTDNIFTHSHAVLLSLANHLTLVHLCATQDTHTSLHNIGWLLYDNWLDQLCSLEAAPSCREAAMVLRRSSRSLCTSLVTDGAGFLHLPATAGQTDRLSPFIWKIHRAYTVEAKEEEDLLYCLSEIPGPRHNHDNCSSAIRGLSTQRQLQPEENSRRNSEAENYQEAGEFAACAGKGDPVPQTTARQAHSEAGHTWASHLALGCSYYSLQPFSTTLDRKITKCNALVT